MLMVTVNNSHAINTQMGDKSSRIILMILLESLYAGPMLKEVYCNRNQTCTALYSTTQAGFLEL